MRQEPRTAGRTCTLHMRKLARLSFSETGMLNITEADVELDEAIDVAEKKLQYATRCIWLEKVALLPCRNQWNGVPMRAPVIFII